MKLFNRAKLNLKGFSHVEGFAILIVILAVVGVGYHVYKDNVAHAGSWDPLDIAITSPAPGDISGSITAQACQTQVGSTYLVQIEATNTSTTYGDLNYVTYTQTAGSAVVTSKSETNTANGQNQDVTLSVPSNETFGVNIYSNDGSTQYGYFFNNIQSMQAVSSPVSGVPSTSSQYQMLPSLLSTCPGTTPVSSPTSAPVVNGQILEGGGNVIYTRSSKGNSAAGFQPAGLTESNTTLAGWSPDGTHVSFWYSTGSGNGSVYTSLADGSDPVKVFSGIEQYLSPISWSPDGTKLAFIQPDGINVVTLATDTDTVVSGTTGSNTSGSSGGGVSWSPDSTSLAYAADVNNVSSICTIEVNGSANNCFASNNETASNDYTFDEFPSWSPNGSTIIYDVSKQVGGINQYAVYSVSSVGTSNALLINNAQQPAWSPDGTQIVYTSCTVTTVGGNCQNSPSNCGIFTVNADGITNKQQISKTCNSYNGVQWGAADGLFTPLQPSRIADTRPGSGQGYAGQTIGSGKVLNINVTGVGGVPSSGVSAVVLNVAEASATTAGYMTAYPTGASLPNASILNYTSGSINNNEVTVEPGTNGDVSFYNSAGNTNLVVDVVGYYSSTGSDTYVPMTPTRIADTRSGSGQSYAGKTVGAGGSLNVQVAGAHSVPSTANAVVANVTTVNEKSSSYLSIYPAGTSKPTASSLNYQAGQILTKTVTVGLGSNGAITVYNAGSGTTDVIVDVVGYYVAGDSGDIFVPIAPARIYDSRVTEQPLGAGATFSSNPSSLVADANIPVVNGSVVNVANPAPVVNALEANLTVASTTASTFLTTYPSGVSLPNSTSVSANPTTGIAFNSTVLGLGSNDVFNVYNAHGTTNFIVDVSGYFY